MTTWQIENLARREWKRLGRPMKFRMAYFLMALHWANNAAAPFTYMPDGSRPKNASVKRALDRWRYYKMKTFRGRTEHLDSEMVRDCLAAINRLKDVDVMAGEGELPPPEPPRSGPTYYPGAFTVNPKNEATRIWNFRFHREEE
jgi:hypothetical protein